MARARVRPMPASRWILVLLTLTYRDERQHCKQGAQVLAERREGRYAPKPAANSAPSSASATRSRMVAAPVAQRGADFFGGADLVRRPLGAELAPARYRCSRARSRQGTALAERPRAAARGALRFGVHHERYAGGVSSAARAPADQRSIPRDRIRRIIALATYSDLVRRTTVGLRSHASVGARRPGGATARSGKESTSPMPARRAAAPTCRREPQRVRRQLGRARVGNASPDIFAPPTAPSTGAGARGELRASFQSCSATAARSEPRSVSPGRPRISRAERVPGADVPRRAPGRFARFRRADRRSW